MGADNWTTCPRCKRRHEKEAVRLRAEAEAAYGNVPRDQFAALETRASEAAFAYKITDFREDYEIDGATDGEVQVIYSGWCRKCGLKVTLDHAHPIDGIEE